MNLASMTLASTQEDEQWMRRALELAKQGEGHVEPNPMVGCVIVRNGQLLAEGYHQRFGGPHAERVALERLPQSSAAGATAYVTLEPCCHYGKTPPCTDALLQSGISRVCCALQDPFPQVSGGGIEQLRRGGIQVELGCCASEAADLIAPFIKRVTRRLPFVIAKWAMSLDGKIATHTGDSRWISSNTSRAHAHAVRGRMDAIVVGSRTARLDDPQLTARLAGPTPPRVATRVVVDSQANLSLDSMLVRTARQFPVLVWAESTAADEQVKRLNAAGCTVELRPPGADRLIGLLEYLSRNQNATNVLFEGGGGLLGALADQDLIDEYHIYIAPKIIGGQQATTPMAGVGLPLVSASPKLRLIQQANFEGDLFLRYRRIDSR